MSLENKLLQQVTTTLDTPGTTRECEPEQDGSDTDSQDSSKGFLIYRKKDEEYNPPSNQLTDNRAYDYDCSSTHSRGFQRSNQAFICFFHSIIICLAKTHDNTTRLIKVVDIELYQLLSRYSKDKGIEYLEKLNIQQPWREGYDPLVTFLHINSRLQKLNPFAMRDHFNFRYKKRGFESGNEILTVYVDEDVDNDIDSNFIFNQAFPKIPVENFKSPFNFFVHISGNGIAQADFGKALKIQCFDKKVYILKSIVVNLRNVHAITLVRNGSYWEIHDSFSHSINEISTAGMFKKYQKDFYLFMYVHDDRTGPKLKGDKKVSGAKGQLTEKKTHLRGPAFQLIDRATYCVRFIWKKIGEARMK